MPVQPSLPGAPKAMHSAANNDVEPLNAPQRILNAALEVFAEFGYTGAATREIARRAAVHQPAIAYHFQSKELLWKASAGAVFKDFAATLDAGLRDAKGDEDRLRRLANIYVRFVALKPQWATFVIHEGMQMGDRNRWLIKTWLRPQSRVLYQAITGRDWPTGDGAAIRQAVSVLGILTGSTLVFAQQTQIRRLSTVDTNSEDFIAQHVKTVFLVLKALQHNL